MTPPSTSATVVDRSTTRTDSSRTDTRPDTRTDPAGSEHALGTAPPQHLPPATLRNTLAIRNFRIISIGQLVSNIGGWTQRVAQDWLVLQLTGSVTAVGITTALQFLPTLMLSPLGGALADRLPKHRILLVTQSVLGACAVTLAALVLTGAAQPWQIYAIALVLGLAIAIDNPTRQSFVGELVGPRHLRTAISINAASFQLGALVGPAIAGVLIALVGLGWGFVANAATFAVALTTLCLVRAADLHPRSSAGARRVGVLQVVRTMRADPHLWWPMVLASAFALFTINLPVVLTAFAADVFRTGPTGLATLTSLLAVGSVVGSVLAARRSSLRLRGLIVMASLVALCEAVAALMPGQAAFGVLMVALGLASVGFGVSANTTVQLAAEDALRGRVMGIYILATLGAGCLGGPLVGLLGEHLGPRGGLLVAAAFSTAVTVLVAVRLARATTPETWGEARQAARERVVAVGLPVSRLVRGRRSPSGAPW